MTSFVHGVKSAGVVIHWGFLLMVLLLAGCGSEEETLFTRQEVIGFVNAIPENDSINIVNFKYLYNGGGVGVGDFDRNGTPDLVFSGNMVSSALYLQTEDWKFEEVTDKAGLRTSVWCAGVNVSDFDDNGWEDIYFATLDPAGLDNPPNLLFLNQGTNEAGVPIFVESAATFGLDDRGYGTHSAWIDLENDGDLDLYILNNAIENFNQNLAKGADTSGKAKSVDRIYQNVIRTGNSEEVLTITEGNSENKGRSAPAKVAEGGIWQATDIVKKEGWGLGVAMQDLNQDGFTDVYVANDFLSEDFLLINRQGNGFTDELMSRTSHQSRNAMGVDIADLNGDGAPEIIVVDMLPDDNFRQKNMFGDIPHRGHEIELARGYAPQFVRNTLQLNTGNGHFTEVGLQAEVAATDWSWTPLLADFDNDGDRDLFVSNGYPKDITNKDFIDFNEFSAQFGTRGKQTKRIVESLDKIGGVHQPNYLFRNDGELSFTRMNSTWLPDEPTYSNGAVFVDLDRDGDLDLVTNNLNEPAGVYRNHSRERKAGESNFLRVDLQGPAGNANCIGTKIWLYAGGKLQYHEHHRQRGYLSTLDQSIHFGLGPEERIDSLIVLFPDGRCWQRKGLATNVTVTVNWQPELEKNPAQMRTIADHDEQIVSSINTNVIHRESSYTDFDHYALAIRDNSHHGPVMITYDQDGDGQRELIFGGAAGQPVSVWSVSTGSSAALTSIATLLVQKKQHPAQFKLMQELEATAPSEATALKIIETKQATYLYVGNGSTEFYRTPDKLADQIYRLENGKWTQLTETASLPELMTSTLSLFAGERDKLPRIFLGSRMKTGHYPLAAPSLILEEKDGAFIPVAELEAGMVTASASGDFNGDGYTDLVTAGEYTPVQFFRGGPDGIDPTGEELCGNGWFYSLVPCDLDNDGDLDLLAGNLGLNASYRADSLHPLQLFASDFDENGSIDPVLAGFIGEEAYPLAPRNTLTKQLPGWKRQIPDFATYGKMTAAELPGLLESELVLAATELRSLYLENEGLGNFTIHYLPALAQTAPIRDAVETTLSNGRKALLAVQNDYAFEPLGGPLNAGGGLLIGVDEKGRPELLESHLGLRVDARSIIDLGDGVLGVGVNDGKLRLLTLFK